MMMTTISLCHDFYLLCSFITITYLLGIVNSKIQLVKLKRLSCVRGDCTMKEKIE